MGRAHTTLAAFLRVDLAPSLTAKELSIHRHTLSYRLDKIAALAGLEPRRFRDAAQLHVAILLRGVELLEQWPATEP